MCLIVFVVEKGKQILGFLVGGHKRGNQPMMRLELHILQFSLNIFNILVLYHFNIQSLNFIQALVKSQS